MYKSSVYGSIMGAMVLSAAVAPAPSQAGDPVLWGMLIDVEGMSQLYFFHLPEGITPSCEAATRFTTRGQVFNLGPTGAVTTSTTTVTVSAGAIIGVAVATTLAIDCAIEGSCIWEEVSASHLSDSLFWCQFLSSYTGSDYCNVYEPNPDCVTTACYDGISGSDIWQNCRSVYSSHVVEDGYLYDTTCQDIWDDQSRDATDPIVQYCADLVDTCVENTIEVCDYHCMMDTSDCADDFGYGGESEQPAATPDDSYNSLDDFHY